MKLNKLMFTGLAVAAIVAQPFYPVVGGDVVFAAPGDPVCVQSNGTCYTSVQDAVNAANSGDTINFMDNVSVSSQVTIAKTLTINGNGKTISGSFAKPAGAAGNSNNSIIGINSPLSTQADPATRNTVIVNNLTIDGTGSTNLHGINAYVSNVVLNNVTIKNSPNAAININGSEVTINGLITSGNRSNTTYGTMELGKGSGVTRSPKLTINGPVSHAETGNAIITQKVAGAVLVTDNTGNYTQFTQFYLSPFLSGYRWKFTAPVVPIPLVITPCEVTTDVHTTSLTTWDMSETRATGHNEITTDGLRIWTEGNTSTDKAAGYFATDFTLQDLGSNTIAGFITGTAAVGAVSPGAQLVVDFNNDGVVDGILVGETVYGDDWWLSNSAAQFAKDGAPNNGGGYGSNWYGTAEEWLNAFPSARVKAIGYSLGSGVLGDYTITKITAGCTDYTFGLPTPTEPETPTTPEVPTTPVVTNPYGGNGEVPTTSVAMPAPAATDEPIAAVAGAADTKATEADKAEVLGEDQAKDALSAQDSKKEWSLVNVLLTIATTVMAIMTLAGIRGSEGRARQLRLLSIVPVAIALIVILAVEDFTAKLGWINGWTLLFVALALAQVALMAKMKPATD